MILLPFTNDFLFLIFCLYFFLLTDLLFVTHFMLFLWFCFINDWFTFLCDWLYFVYDWFLCDWLVYRLKDEQQMCQLLESLQGYVEKNGTSEEICRCYLRRIEHIYFKVLILSSGLQLQHIFNITESWLFVLSNWWIMELVNHFVQ